MRDSLKICCFNWTYIDKSAVSKFCLNIARTFICD